MIQKNKRPLPKEFCIQPSLPTPSPYIPKEEPKVIFTAEQIHKTDPKKEPHSFNVPTASTKNILAPAVAAMILMDVLK